MKKPIHITYYPLSASQLEIVFSFFIYSIPTYVSLCFCWYVCACVHAV